MQTLEKPRTLDSYSDKELIETERAVAQKNPLYLLTAEYLYIKTKVGELKQLHFNTSQQKLFNQILTLRKQGKRIRAWILKYRQGGVSTFIEALIYAFTSQQENRNSLIMADEKDKSDYLFQMSKLYHEQLEINRPYLAPELKKSNAKVLEFEGLHSQIIIETAENIDAARAFTYQYVHLSECAFFKSLKGVLDGLNQSVPDHSDTMILGETTANGMGEFYKEWLRAIEGKTDWLPIFLAWFMMEEYTMPLQNGELYPLKGINFGVDTSQTVFEKEEFELKVEFSLTDEQLNWRRWCIVNKCQGDIIRFKTEYPSTWQEAFSLSGSMFFDRRGLERQLTRKPLAIGELFYQNMEWEFREIAGGRIKVYERPVKGEQYLITCDASEAVDLDEASIFVGNKRTNATSAEVSGNITPEELAELAVALGNWYNQALIAPENKGYGYMVCQNIYKKYGNLYKTIKTETGAQEETEDLGFNTNTVTRPQMLAQMNEEVKNNSTDLRSEKLLSQCRTFVIKKDKEGNVTKIEHQSGCQDGLVICRAIFGLVRMQFPYKVILKNDPTHSKKAAVIDDIKKQRRHPFRVG